jgi:hypothetical protein
MNAMTSYQADSSTSHVEIPGSSIMQNTKFMGLSLMISGEY